MEKRIIELKDEESQFTHLFECPGCGSDHGVIIDKGRWSFDGNFERPTLSPSILVRGYLGKDAAGNSKYGTCHSFVKSGKIQFLNDCTHELAGQTIDLPVID